MSDNLQKMFIEDAPQDVDNLKGVENLSTLVLELQKLEDEIKDKESQLKSTKEKADKLSQVAIPEIMEALKMKTMKLADGSAIEIKEIYSATIPTDKKEGAYNWLRENGLGDLIKNEINVFFRERSENKEELPSEHFNLFKGNKTKITRSK